MKGICPIHAEPVHRDFGIRTVVVTSVVVMIVYLIGIAILVWGTDQIQTSSDFDNARNAMSLFAAVLAVLAGGCITGFFAFEYSDAKVHEKRSVVFVLWLFLSGIFLFIFLSMYCLYKIGTFGSMDKWAIALLLMGTYAVLDALVLLERWDATQLPQ